MNDHPDTIALRRLIAAHPAIFRSQEPRVWRHLPPGWYDILDRLCSGIEAVLGDEIGRFRVEQIKEKYGTLRFYYSLDGRAKLSMDITASGSRARMQERSGDRPSVRIDELIDRAEEESSRTCEECGAAARLRESNQGWLHTTCDAHAKPEDRLISDA